jgi:hypothetical protein
MMLEFVLSEERDTLDIVLDEAGWEELKRVVELAFRSGDHQHMFNREWGISEAVLDVSEDSPTSLGKVTIYPSRGPSA